MRLPVRGKVAVCFPVTALPSEPHSFAGSALEGLGRSLMCLLFGSLSGLVWPSCFPSDQAALLNFSPSRPCVETFLKRLTWLFLRPTRSHRSGSFVADWLPLESCHKQLLARIAAHLSQHDHARPLGETIVLQAAFQRISLPPNRPIGTRALSDSHSCLHIPACQNNQPYNTVQRPS